MQDFTTVLMSQLMDPFRIGLLVALLATTVRNAAATGWVLPLAAGIAFVAYIIAITFPASHQTTWQVAGVGLISNAILTAILFVLWMAYRKFQR